MHLSLQQIRPAIVMLVALTVITGVLYPLALTLTAGVLAPGRAAGGLVRAANGEVVGSTLLAQGFSDPAYFWPRPSAVSYNAAGSGGSNLGPRSAALRKQTEERVATFDAATGVPAELITTSGSGLDPHLSPAAARFQATRVAAARGTDVQAVLALIEDHLAGRQWGFLGEPTVNVLELNRALGAPR